METTRTTSVEIAPISFAESGNPDSPWVVLKFGGTSVSSLGSWQTICAVVRQRLEEGVSPMVVHSALAGVSDQLEAVLGAAIAGQQLPLLESIRARHVEFAAQLGVDSQCLDPYLEELEQLAAGIQLIAEVSPRVHVRVLALGELLATRIGASYLKQQGLDVEWVDVREWLQSDDTRAATERARYLSAVCDYQPDERLQNRFAGMQGVVLTQGFIAGNEHGDTVLLGRGGSDTSAAYLAAKLAARRLEIWTDVPGMFSADPRAVPSARLLRALRYREAQEIASTGGGVLHPRCIPPVRQYSIPLYIRCTSKPGCDGTVISREAAEDTARVKAISSRSGIVLVSMETVGMWHQVGFLAEVFQCFAARRLSVDLISTSESNVTVSIDTDGQALEAGVLDALLGDLAPLCRVELIDGCAAVSLVGHKIRAILHELGPALEAFEEYRIHLVTQAANDLNLTFVVQEDQAYRLVQKLHGSMIRRYGDGSLFGDTWEQLQGEVAAPVASATAWWRDEAEQLITLAKRESAAYVYHLGAVDRAIADLHSLEAVEQVFYAVKANSNPAVLTRIEASGVNFECVSPGEIEHVLELFPQIDRQRILYTPNFAPYEEYSAAFSQSVWVTLDNLYPLRAWPELFAERSLFVRVDPGQGRGHHEHVRTAGVHSKFGVPLFEIEELARLCQEHGVTVVGLHAHTGSGILGSDNWRTVATALAEVAGHFPSVRVLDLGGGLGVPERPGERRLDLREMDERLAAFKEAYPDYALWLEPGRYLVAEAGVLVAEVTQTKGKGEVRYVGVSTGMNSLIRPALYGAYHEIVNLSRLSEPATEIVNIVGPICETGDRLGSDRLLPVCREGDVILIANAGAYGFVMSSLYNLRAPAQEFIL